MMPEDAKFVYTDPEVLLGRIKDTFADLSWTKYEYINEGWDHEVIILDKSIVFRFPNDEEYSKLLSNEIRVLKTIKPLVSVRIPEYIFVAPNESFAGYKIVAGKTLHKKQFDKLITLERQQLAKQLAGFLSTLHTLVKKGFDLSFVAPSDIKDYQDKAKDQAQQYLKDVLGKEDFAFVINILQDTDELLNQLLPSVFLHGDIYHNHLLWDSKAKQLGVIDFSDMNRGDPAFDFAEIYEYGTEFANQVYKLYTGPRDATLMQRALQYFRWVGVYMMIDHFIYHKTSFKVARETFDISKKLK